MGHCGASLWGPDHFLERGLILFCALKVFSPQKQLSKWAQVPWIHSAKFPWANVLGLGTWVCSAGTLSSQRTRQLVSQPSYLQLILLLASQKRRKPSTLNFLNFSPAFQCCPTPRTRWDVSLSYKANFPETSAKNLAPFQPHPILSLFSAFEPVFQLHVQWLTLFCITITSHLLEVK